MLVVVELVGLGLLVEVFVLVVAEDLEVEDLVVAVPAAAVDAPEPDDPPDFFFRFLFFFVFLLLDCCFEVLVVAEVGSLRAVAA